MILLSAVGGVRHAITEAKLHCREWACVEWVKKFGTVVTVNDVHGTPIHSTKHGSKSNPKEMRPKRV
jgi:hypothetical protein